MTPADNPHSIDLLMVEDNPGDVYLIREGFEAGRIRPRLSVVPDGVEAEAFLRREGPYGSAPRPHLILLDLNLPRRGGVELLERIKSDPGLRRIPVVVFTSSEAELDIVRSYDAGANCYISKPLSLAGVHEVIEAVDAFWFSVVRLPPTSSGRLAS